jgi:gamma-glutamylcyclotransferase (GGCT)/AIG2-like uncharacterized protein YtfP
MLYFAYGSNMNVEQMKARCPLARMVAIAAMSNHRLAFTRGSTERRCGVADAVPAAGEMLWGAVYDIEKTCLKSLDKSEGYRPGPEKNSYWRKECVVLLNGHIPTTVSTYFAESQPHPPLPNRTYKALIVSGAHSCKLPEYYIQGLERIQVSEDDV